MIRLHIFLIVWSVVIFSSPATAFEKVPEELIAHGGYSLKTCSKTLQYRENELFIPASTLKIVTSLVALELLGPEYRFETHFYVDLDNNLYIKGSGDPFITSESIFDIGQQLLAVQGGTFQALYLDDSNFRLSNQIAGETATFNPYDAPNGSLSVNFNSLPIEVKNDASILSGEQQTPFIPLMTEAAALKLKPGLHRLNIEKVVPSSVSLPSSLRYAGELFRAIFSQTGIHFKKGYARKHISDAAIKTREITHIFTYRSSRTLAEMVKACLKYSNNFTANQLFLSLGIEVSGPPATWQKSRQIYKKFLSSRLNLYEDQILVAEGSGLSKNNRISPYAMVTILNAFKPYAELLPAKGSTLLKSGTLDGVYSYAGYLPQKSRLDPFAILLNQNINNREILLSLFEKLHRSQNCPSE